MYSSADGSTWTATSSPVLGYSGMGLFMFDRASLAVRNGTVYVLFCGIDGDLPAQYFSPDTGLAQSTDEGKTWTPLPVPTSGAPFRTSSRLVFQEMGNDEQTLIVPTGSNELLVGGIGLWMTPDITASNPIWSDISIHTPLVYPGQHAVAAVNSTTWFDGTEGGVWLTSDSGSTWSDDNATLADHQLFDASPEGSPGAYVAADGQLGTGVANNDGTLAWSQSASSSSLNTAVDPDNPQHVYAQNNAFALISDDGGKTFSNGFRLPDVLYTGPGGTPPPFEVLPQRPSDLIFSSCQLWLGSGYAEPFGGDVRAVSFDLSQDGPESDCSQLKGFVFGIASAPSDANVLYAVTTNRRVMGTTNLFADKPVWTNLTADPLPTTPNHPFSAIAVSPTDAKTVYVGVGGFQTPHVFKSSDGGASWMDVTGNLPDAPVNSITVDPVDPTNVYVATDAGVFVATDGGVTGETWQVLGPGCPTRRS